MELSIVMPCLNEARTLVPCVKEALEALRIGGIDGEVIVADNGSTDGSQALATEAGARVVTIAEKGYGNALRGGFLAARGQFLAMGDSDQSYDFRELVPMVEKLRKGADIVMGNRFAGKIMPGAMPWKNRYIGNPILSAIGQLFFKTTVRDFHCGLRALRKDAFVRMELRTTGMEFASEMVIKAMLLKLRVEETPTTLRPDGRDRPPHLRPWRDGWRHLRFMLLFSPRWLFLYPGVTLSLAGTVITTLLLYAPVTVGGVTFDIHTMIYSTMAILAGVQAASFGFSTKVFAMNSGLRPADPKFLRLFRWVSLELGLLLGIILICAGLAISLGALWHWQVQEFGALSPRVVMRAAIPGALCLTLGSQVLLTSFFLSVLGLKFK
jgi:glycosyltransferase involved in cell wall biosynthesis